MKLPFRSKPTEKKVHLLEAPGKPFPLVFISKSDITASESAYVLEMQRTNGSKSLEVGQRIKEIAEKVAPFNGGDPNAVAKALIEYRNGRGYSSLFDEYSGYFGMYAAAEVEDFQIYLAKVSDEVDSAAQVTVMMQRALKNAELEYDPKKWKIEQANELEPFFARQVLEFYYIEQAGRTEDFLTPIEGTDEFIFEYKYEQKNKKETPKTDAEEKQLEEVAGKS